MKPKNQNPLGKDFDINSGKDFLDISKRYGFGVASVAANRLCRDGKVPSKEDLIVLCNRMVTFPLEASDNPTNVSLCAYDALLNKSGGAAS